VFRARVIEVYSTDKREQKAQGRTRPRIHWCPTGPFTFVPLHAAGIYEGPNQECCSDYVVSSYTPTFTALIEARKGLLTFIPSQMKVMTLAAEHAQDISLPPLRYAVPETRGVTEIMKSVGATSVHSADAAGTNEVLGMFQSSQVVHLACHGIQYEGEPHNSHFCLSTGKLTIAELMNMDLRHSFFAYLSACETAKGDKQHADEVIHLAASMLFAGFKSVVATMW
jgi:CHAT domain-containing protein